VSPAVLRLGPVVLAVLALVGRTGAADPLPKGAVVRFGEPRLQHFTIGGPLAFSPDGKFLATGGANTPVCIWNAGDGRFIATAAGAGSIFDLAWTADGELVGLAFFGHNSYMMHRWAADGTTGLTDERRRELHEAVDRVRRDGRLDRPALSADGRRVLLVRSFDRPAGRRAEVYAFAANTPTSLATPEKTVPLSPGNGAWLSRDGKVLLAHEARTKDRAQRLVAFDLGAKTFDRPTWAIELEGESSHTPFVCLSADGKRLVVQFVDDAVEVWDGPGDKRLYALPEEPKYHLRGGGEWPALDLSPDGTRLARLVRLPSGEMGGRIYDLDTGKAVVTLSPGPLPRAATWRARFTPDGARVAHAGYGALRVWDAKTGAEAVPLPGHRGPVNSVAVTPDGKTVVTGGADLTVRGWDPETGRERWRAALPQVHRVRFVTADAVVVEEDWGGASATPLLAPATGKARKLPGAMAEDKPLKDAFGGRGVSRDALLAVSPDGKSAVTLEPQKPALRVWSWPAGELKATLPIEAPDKLTLRSCPAAHVTEDGKQLVALMLYAKPFEFQGSRSGPDHTPYLERWDLAAGKRVEQTDLGHGTTPALVSNGSRVLVVRDGGEVRDALTGKEVAKLTADEGRALDLRYPGGMALSPDGAALAVGSPWAGDGAVRVFDLKTGRARQTWAAGDRYRHVVAFLPDGRLVSGGDAALVWPADK
jgi:WD40 repeat protein